MADLKCQCGHVFDEETERLSASAMRCSACGTITAYPTTAPQHAKQRPAATHHRKEHY